MVACLLGVELAPLSAHCDWWWRVYSGVSGNPVVRTVVDGAMFFRGEAGTL